MKSSLKNRIRKLENSVLEDVGKSEEAVVQEFLAGRSPESIEYLEELCRETELIWKYEDEFDKQLAAGAIEGVSCPSVKMMDFFDSEILFALALKLEGKYDLSEKRMAEFASLLQGVTTSR